MSPIITKFKKNKSKKNLSYFLFKMGGVFIVLIFLALVFVDINVYYKKNQFNRQVNSLEKKMKDLEEKNEKLREGISNEDNEHYIERVAREEMDLQLPGEKVVSFIDVKEDPKEELPDDDYLISFWLSWIGGFFKK
ncbi:MAG: septum formation initiator family protein [Candidatus Staskawiczbacteria bacterium]|nr:septum formation initiator family protein [Candidatus Staskawiczbacteria bacterium]